MSQPGQGGNCSAEACEYCSSASARRALEGHVVAGRVAGLVSAQVSVPVWAVGRAVAPVEGGQQAEAEVCLNGADAASAAAWWYYEEGEGE